MGQKNGEFGGMGSKKTVNTFENGVELGVNVRKQPKGTVRRARNVEFLRQGDGLAVSNIKGTTELVTETAGADLNILASIPCWGKVDSQCTGSFDKRRGILYFEYDDTNKSRIRFFDTEDEVYYQLFPDPLNAAQNELAFPINGTVDVRYYADNGNHYAYFTDHTNNFRVIEIKCYGGGCITYPDIDELVVRPLHPIDCLEPQTIPVATGGSLLPGSYIAVYRYFNTTTCRYSGWSNPTNPIPVIPLEGNETDVLPGSTGQYGYTSNQWGGKIGQNTDKKLKLEINTTHGAANYDAIQLLVIPSVDGTKTTPTTGLLTNPSTEWYTDPTDIEFDGNDYTVVDLSDYLIDDLPIVSAKTMEIKDGRVFLGNFNTRDFVFDNGDPITSNVETITANVDYRDETDVTHLKGYFREELYGFGIYYYDEFGNGVVCPYDFSEYGIDKETLSAVSMEITLDNGDGTYEAEITTADVTSFGGSDYIEVVGERATVIGIRTDDPAPGTSTVELRADSTMTVTNIGNVTFIGGAACNQGTGWAWKFPSRNQDGFSLFSSGSSNPLAIGLRIEGIQNHPSWAVGFKIVRLKRKKDILGQFPHVPTIAVNGNRTPGLEVESVEDEDYSGVQDTFLPKVHLLGAARNLEKYEFTNPLDATEQLSVLRWQRQTALNDENEIIPLLCAYVPEYMYNVDGESFDLRDSGGAQLSIADAVLLRYYEDKQELFGSRIKDTVSRYTAFRKEQYFYNYEHRIEEGGQEVLYKKIEDTTGFLESLSNNNTKIDWQLEVPYDSAFLTIPGYRPNHAAYEHILSFGRLLELISDQGGHPSVPGWIARVFYNPLDAQNMRQLLLKSTSPIIDFTDTVWDRTINDNDEYFPLNTWTPDANVIGDSFLQTAIATVNIEYEFTPAVANEDYAGAALILNIKKGLGDDRYGDIGSIQGEWIDTGVCVPLTPADISGNTSFDVDVWGGDCYITRHSFKVRETAPMPATYNPIDTEIDDPGLPAGSYMKTGKTLTGVEIIECWLESEVNSHHVYNDGKYPQRGLLSDVPPPANLDISVSPLRGKFEHYYIPGYSVPFPKVYTEKITFCEDRTEFKDALCWSDIRVRGAVSTPLNDVNGFDKFRTNNIWVLDAKYGDITKLITLEDKALHIFQEKKIAFQPVGVDEIQTQDGNIISTGTGNVLGTGEYYLPYDFGCQHMRTVISYDGKIYGIDVLRRTAFYMGSRGGGFKAYSIDGFDPRFREIVSVEPTEQELFSFIDPVREKLWTMVQSDNDLAVGWNLKGQYWEGEYDMNAFNGQGVDNRLFLIDSDGSLHELYVGNYNVILGQDVAPTIDVIVNDAEAVTKVLQNIEISSVGKPYSTQFYVMDNGEATPIQISPELVMRDIHNGGYFENRITGLSGGYSRKFRGKVFRVRIKLDDATATNVQVLISALTSTFRQSK